MDQPNDISKLDLPIIEPLLDEPLDSIRKKLDLEMNELMDIIIEQRSKNIIHTTQNESRSEEF